MKTPKPSVLCILVLLSGLNARAAVFTNGSFETPLIQANSVQGLPMGDTSVTGWTVGGTIAGTVLMNGLPPNSIGALDGSQFIVFNSGGFPTGGTIAQTFDTESGQSYIVKFRVGKLGSGPALMSLSAVATASNGAVLGVRLSSQSATGWGATNAFPFIATTATSTLTFEDTSESSTNIAIADVALESVSVESAEANCVGQPSGLVSWWTAEGNAADATGTNAGTLMSGATFDSGMVGQAFSLNGSSAFVQVPDAPSLRFTNAMTVEAWVFSSVPLGQFGAVITKWDGGVNQRSYSLSIQPSGKMALGINSDGQDNGSDIGNAFSLAPFPTNQWTHVCGVYDGVAIKLYVNGVLQETTAWPQGIFPSTVPLSIGSALISGAFFKGLIDELSLYNRALTSTEVQDIFNAGQKGKCPTLGPPAITTQPQGQSGYWGGSVSFQVRIATNALPLSYLWYYEGLAISWATNSTITLTNLGLSDGGHFQVVITNSLGSITSSPALLVVNPAGVSLGLTPTLFISGTVGKTFGIQYSPVVNDSNAWTTLTNFMLSQPVQLWFDTNVDVSSGVHPRRFYRVIAVP